MMACWQNIKNVLIQLVIGRNQASLGRLELPLLAPEANALSTELQGRIGDYTIIRLFDFGLTRPW